MDPLTTLSGDPLLNTATPEKDITVSGQIMDENGSPLPGATVEVKGTYIGTVTDAQGHFSFSISNDATALVVSFVGYRSQELTLGNTTVFNVVMQPDLTSLDEVVVTALGIKREERSLSYSVQEIEGAGLTSNGQTNMINSLSGQVAGLQVTGNTSMGSSARITLRGVNSLTGNNQPLFVIDGTPVDNSNFNFSGTENGDGGVDYGNALQDINPNDIESVSVLKGATAAALYGSRASNGVVLITTKSGKNSTRRFEVSINSTTTFDRVNILPDYQNDYGQGSTPSFIELDNGQRAVQTRSITSWGPRFEGQMVRHWDSFIPGAPEFGELRPWTANPDNVRDFYETGITTMNNIAILGNTEAGNFRFSYGNTYQDDIVPFGENIRHNFNLVTDIALNEQLSIGANVNYIYAQLKNRPNVGNYTREISHPVQHVFLWSGRQIDWNRSRQIFTEDGTVRQWNMVSENNISSAFWDNPYWILNISGNEQQRNRVLGNVRISYQINPSLKISGFVRSDFYTDLREDWNDIGGREISFFQKELFDVREFNYELLGEYAKDLNENFSISGIFGANYRRNRIQRDYGATNGGLSVPGFLSLQASLQRPNIVDFLSEQEVASIYGSFSLGFKDLVYMDGSLRNDWSSTLPVDNNAYLYPSLGASFIFSELVSQSTLLSYGKARVSFAQVGNDTDPYRIGLVYASLQSIGDQPSFTVPNTLNNTDLRPEITNSFEYGLSLKLLNSRISLDATYYDNVTRDQIIPIPVSGTSGFFTNIINAGKVKNRGIELQLLATLIENQGGFSWDMGFNYARNNNEVEALAEGITTLEIDSRNPNVNGQGFKPVTINAEIGQPYGQMIGSGYVRNDRGEILVDNNGFFERAEGVVIGNIMPDYFGGVTSTLRYKNISLFGLVDYKIGGDVFSITNQDGAFSGTPAFTAGTNDLGNPVRNPVSEGGGIIAAGVLQDGTPNNRRVEAQNYWQSIGNFNGLDEPFVFDASYVKLREVRLSYTLPETFLEKLPFRRCSLDVFSRNVAILHRNARNIDPEVALGSGNIQGIEASKLPSTRSLGFSVQLGF